MNKLIGGAALVKLGSSRRTLDVVYLTYDDSNEQLFIHDHKENVDYVNAAASDFLRKIWETESKAIGELATPKTLLLLKAWAFINHCQNGYWQRADDAEYDIRFIVRTLGATDVSLLSMAVSAAELKEVQKIIDDVKR